MADVDDSEDAAEERRRERAERNTPRLGGVDFLDARMQALEKQWRIAEAARSERTERAAVDRAVLLGVDGQPGRLGVLEARLTAIETRAGGIEGRIGVLETWRTSFMAKIAISIALGTTVAGVATALLVKWVTFR